MKRTCLFSLLVRILSDVEINVWRRVVAGQEGRRKVVPKGLGEEEDNSRGRKGGIQQGKGVNSGREK